MRTGRMGRESVDFFARIISTHLPLLDRSLRNLSWLCFQGWINKVLKSMPHTLLVPIKSLIRPLMCHCVIMRTTLYTLLCSMIDIRKRDGIIGGMGPILMMNISWISHNKKERLTYSLTLLSLWMGCWFTCLCILSSFLMSTNILSLYHVTQPELQSSINCTPAITQKKRTGLEPQLVKPYSKRRVDWMISEFHSGWAAVPCWAGSGSVISSLIV